MYCMHSSFDQIHCVSLPNTYNLFGNQSDYKSVVPVLTSIQPYIQWILKRWILLLFYLPSTVHEVLGSL